MNSIITIYSVLLAAKTALRTSPAIASWATSSYSATVKIFVGEDGLNPPREADAPFIVLAPGVEDYDMGTGAELRQPVIEVDFGVLEDGKTSMDSGNTISIDGIEKADTFGNLIRDCLQTAFGDSAFRSCTYSLDNKTRFPLIEGGMTIKLAKETTLGEEPSL